MAAHLTKLTVARQQLATAIELLFAGKDIISIYSLATNAWEVIDVLCVRAEIESMSEQVRENVPKGKSLKHAYINSPYRNFFKHADNDTDLTLEPLPYSQLEGVLFLAVEDYIRLNRQSPVQLQVYQLWYLAKHPEKLDPDVAGSLKDDVTRIFPNLYAISRTDQIALGAGLLLKFLNDEEMKKDPRTECAFE